MTRGADRDNPDRDSTDQAGAGPAVLVRARSSGEIRTVTLDSPHYANALSTALLTQLRAALADAMSDPGVRVVVLTGAGKVFCAGADLKEALTNPSGATGLMSGVVQLLWDSSKPVICRVNGAARAGGIGLVAAVISVPCLRRMPSRAAADYFLTGEVFDARRATEIGLLTRAAPADDL